MSEVARTDPLSVCNARSVKQVSAKTANHDLKALKMMFKSARRDSVITEDPTEFVEPVRKERASKIKRPFGE
jgi:site-specific recombinase XerD